MVDKRDLKSMATLAMKDFMGVEVPQEDVILLEATKVETEQYKKTNDDCDVIILNFEVRFKLRNAKAIYRLNRCVVEVEGKRDAQNEFYIYPAEDCEYCCRIEKDV